MTPLGNYLTRQKLTGRLFFQRVGQPQVDLGNVLLVKQEPKIDRAQQLTLSKGRAQITHEEPSKIDLRWSFKLDEQLGAQLQLLNLAKEVDASQVAASKVTPLTDGSGNLLVPLGENVFIGFYSVTNVTVSSDLTGDVTEGTDYLVDRASGMFMLLSDPSGVPNVILSFDCPNLTLKNYTLLSESFVRGTAMIVLADETAPNIREKIVFSAEIRASDWGENDGAKNQEYSLELIELAPATVLARE